jgi:hypothetical protein
LPELDKILTYKEVCWVYKVSRWTLWRWKNAGCPFVRNRITLALLLEWLKRRENDPQADRLARRLSVKAERRRRRRGRKR